MMLSYILKMNTFSIFNNKILYETLDLLKKNSSNLANILIIFSVLSLEHRIKLHRRKIIIHIEKIFHIDCKGR